MSLQNEIDKLKTLQESFSELSKKVLDTQAVLTELNHGKQEMVDALAMKNVQSSTDKTLSAIASDVRSIAQSPVTIDGGEMYEKQLFGAATDKTNAYEQPDTPLWNLSQVMANILSDGRFAEYGGIVLCEYNKDGVEKQLSGCPLGGAYLTCEGDLYYEDVLHVWHDDEFRKCNRWVAYLLKNEYTDIALNEYINPITIHIGRKIGIISTTINLNLSDIICDYGGEYSASFQSGTQKWNDKVILHGVNKLEQGCLIYNNANVNIVQCDVKEIGVDAKLMEKSTNIKAIHLPNLKEIRSKYNGAATFNNYNNIEFFDAPELELVYRDDFFAKSNKLRYINLPKLKKVSTEYETLSYGGALNYTQLERIELPSLEYLGVFDEGTKGLSYNSLLKEVIMPNLIYLGGTEHVYSDQVLQSNPLLERVVVGTFIHTTKRLNYWFPNCPKLIDIEIGNGVDMAFNFSGWNPTSVLEDDEQIVILNQNIREHIAARVTDRSGLSSLTITLSQQLRNALTEETEQAFAAKNWNIAPAKSV